MLKLCLVSVGEKKNIYFILIKIILKINVKHYFCEPTSKPVSNHSSIDHFYGCH